jgi:uncharacterized protein
LAAGAAGSLLAMRPHRRHPLAVALLALALGLAAGGPAAAGAAERTVAVSGEATLKVPNDSASAGFAVSRERRGRGAALRAVPADLAGVIAAVQAIPGVGAGDVTTGRISVEKRARGEKTDYRASEGISVTLHQPERAGELVSAAIAAGASGVSGPNFFVGDTEAAFAKALAAAFDVARTKATALAAEAGASLGPVLTIEEGGNGEFVPQGSAKAAPHGCATATAPTPAATTQRCTATPPPTKPGSSTVTASVHVVFALQ